MSTGGQLKVRSGSLLAITRVYTGSFREKQRQNLKEGVRENGHTFIILERGGLLSRSFLFCSSRHRLGQHDCQKSRIDCPDNSKKIDHDHDLASGLITLLPSFPVFCLYHLGSESYSCIQGLHTGASHAVRGLQSAHLSDSSL